MKKQKLIKSMRGYKVVCGDGKEGRFSCGTIMYSVQYPPKEIVKPILKNSMLFFFKNKEDAESYVNSFNTLSWNYSIVPCIASFCKKAEEMSAYSFNIKEFWKGKNILKNKPPKGTWLAKSIECLE